MWWLTYQDSPGSTETSLLTTAGGAAVAGAELGCRTELQVPALQDLQAGCSTR